MPFESLIGSGFVVLAMAIFGAALAYGDWASRHPRRR